MFESPASAQGILGYGYANLPFETKSTTDIATDDAVTNDLENSYRMMSQGTWTANNDPLSQWQARRIAIQYMNIFLKHVDQVTWSQNAGKQQMFIDKLTGEALALRALNMYYLLRNHGGWTAGGELQGVPIILEPEGMGSDFNQPRASFQACVEAIYADVDKAMELLPYDYVKLTNDADVPAKYQAIGVTNAGEYSAVFGDTFRGRMSGRMAQTVKALTALLAASPAYTEGTDVTYADAANELAEVLKTIGGAAGVDPTGYKWFMEKKTLDALGSGECPLEILWRGSMNNGTESYAFGISQESDNFPIQQQILTQAVTHVLLSTYSTTVLLTRMYRSSLELTLQITTVSTRLQHLLVPVTISASSSVTTATLTLHSRMLRSTIQYTSVTPSSSLAMLRQQTRLGALRVLAIMVSAHMT